MTDRLVTGKLPSLAQELCLVTMVTFATSRLTKAQGICYLKPAPCGSQGFGRDADQWAHGPGSMTPIPAPPWLDLPAASHIQNERKD